MTSANLVAQFEAVLTPEQRWRATTARNARLTRSWPRALLRLAAASAPGLEMVAGADANEYAMVQWLSDAMTRDGLIWENGPRSA